MNFPRVLIVAMGRINAADNSNNGLLLRNIFAAWPRENLAQIFSSGSNGDHGYFGSYYQLGPQDRFLGGLFYKLKAEELAEISPGYSATSSIVPQKNILKLSVKSIVKHWLVDSGFYEMIFRPRLSKDMTNWIEAFHPDIIFSQGYCLTFSWLPLMLSKQLKLPIAYYPTDDWPSESYRYNKKSASILSRIVTNVVTSSSIKLVNASTVNLAFNRYMQEEYLKRYGREFTVLMHGDDFSRYQFVSPLRLAASDEWWIVSTGIFDKSRKLLLHDLERACELLNARGIRVRATVFPVNMTDDISNEKNEYFYINFKSCPSHNDLVPILKGADILFLPERFDDTAQGIRMSISSKAHLFMFTEKPIVVYSSAVTGIARYAYEEGWATVVDCKDATILATAFENIINSEDVRKNLTMKARNTAIKHHDLLTIQSSFLHLIKSAVGK